MPLDKDRLGTAWANTVKAFRPAAGTAITDAELENMWKQLADDIITEFQTNAIVGGLPAGDYKDSLSLPVTGTSGSKQGAIT